MNLRIRLLSGLALLLLSVAPAWANRAEVGASGYGDTDPNCVNLMTNCQSATQLSNTVAGKSGFFILVRQSRRQPCDNSFRVSNSRHDHTRFGSHSHVSESSWLDLWRSVLQQLDRPDARA